jgi:hypothetical protein
MSIPEAVLLSEFIAMERVGPANTVLLTRRDGEFYNGTGQNRTEQGMAFSRRAAYSICRLLDTNDDGYGQPFLLIDKLLNERGVLELWR